MMIKKNKKGWIRVIESFLSILLVITIVLIAMNKYKPDNYSFSQRLYNMEKGILRYIELNSTLRTGILLTSGVVEWNDTNFVPLVNQTIRNKVSSDVDCVAKICPPSNQCLLTNPAKKDIYSSSVMITTEGIIYNPRVLKIFCWEK